MALDITTSINLDMKAPNAEIVYGNQYDSVGYVNAQLLNDGEKWAVPSGAVATVSYMKTDKIGGYYDTTTKNEVAVTFPSSDRSIIKIALDEQTLTTIGNVNVQVNFYQSNRRLSTFSFVLNVKASPITATNIDSKWFGNLLIMSGVTVDDTLSIAGAAADAKMAGKKVNKPVISPNGVSGQILSTNGDGTTTWINHVAPTDEQVENAVSDWLDDHPEATTTVEDGSISEVKLATDVKSAIDSKAITLQRPLRFLQITDTHFDDKDSGYYGIAHEERMNRVVDWILSENAKNPLDFVIHTGDITYENKYTDGTNPDYIKKFYDNFASQLPCPFYSMCGNHDGHSNAEFKNASGLPRQYTVEFGDIVLVVLDVFGTPPSTGTGGSYVGVDTDFLQSVLALDTEGKKKYILFAHFFLRDSESSTFNDIVDTDDRILYLVCGHTHAHNVADYGQKKIVYGGNVAFWMDNGTKQTTFSADYAWGYTIHEVTQNGLVVQHIQPAGLYFTDDSYSVPVEFAGAISAPSVVTEEILYKKTYDFSLEKDKANANMYRESRVFERAYTLGQGREILPYTDLNDVVETGVYFSGTSSKVATLSNVPEEVTTGFRMIVDATQDLVNDVKTSIYVRQTIYPNQTNNFVAFRRISISSGGSSKTTSPWVIIKNLSTSGSDIRELLEYSTQAQIVTLSAPANTGAEITIPNSTRGFGVITGTQDTLIDIFTFFSTGSGSTSCNSLIGSTNYTYTCTTNKIVIRHAGGATNTVSFGLYRMYGTESIVMEAASET